MLAGVSASAGIEAVSALGSVIGRSRPANDWMASSMTGGRERDATAWTELLATSSFDTVRTIAVDMAHEPLTIIEAIPRR